MTLASGTRLGPYEIVAPLGAGGMGEVYKARDTRLERTVALKVIPGHLAQDPELKQRLVREARAISSLSHPHICALYDIGSEDGLDYLVMEYLEGETLADRLAKGPLPPELVLRYGREIAEALERAHKEGVVHRDLKPANVMLTKSGVKLLDFGLAKLRVEAAEPAVSYLPTRVASKPLTEKGTILGTFQYMSPEQLEGKEADGRSDIFALGSVLHEMATGRKAFSGTSQASLIAAILASEPPPISSIQKMTPPALDRLVKTCLAKDPDERWQSAHDVAAELKWIGEGGSQVGAPAPLVARRRSRERLAWGAAALFAVLALAALAVPRGRAELRSPIRLSFSIPPKASYKAFDSLAPSPDGRSIAFVAYTAGDRTLIAVRAVDSGETRMLAGTEGAASPFWSPDSRSLAFFADGKLKRIDLAGGPQRTLTSAAVTHGGSWGKGDTIIFASDPGGGIQTVPADGGTPRTITKLNPGEEGHRWPAFLPDGRRFVFLADAPTTAGHTVRLGSLDSLESKRILQAVSSVAFAPPDLVLFVRAESLLAQRFDTETGKTIGEPTSLGAPVANIAFNHLYDFGIGGDLLAYQSISAKRRLVWYDRSGKRLEDLGEPGLYAQFRISPDGRRLAFSTLDEDRRDGSIWVRDIVRGTVTRLTSGSDGDSAPVWAPAGDRIFFSSLRNGAQGNIYATPSGGGGPDELILTTREPKYVDSISPDGKELLIEIPQPKGSTDLAFVSLADRKIRPLVEGPYIQMSGIISPDGRLVAYMSDETGQAEVYLKSLAGGARIQLSNGRGLLPRWRADGKELFFAGAGGTILAVTVKPGDALETDPPRPLFSAGQWSEYDVSPDGQRFLLSMPLEENAPVQATVVVNWRSALPR